ncbi:MULTISPECIES: hypothetical protein [unclassified Cupriavidus]|uniref:hypothetical protein n=1 Tax=unclassified Cupriavidus TaxID=2640874 RepID=UPI00313D9A25
MAAPQEGPRKWFDATISLQWLVGAAISAIAAAGATAAVWFSLVGRVQALELKDIDHAAHFARIEENLRQQRQETTEKLNAIGQNVEKIRDYLLDNAAGQRPEIKRWTR